MEKQLIEVPDDWSSKAASFLLEKLSEADLFAAAASSRKAETKRDQTCDAWYYAGMKRLLAGDKSTAIADFHKSIATQATSENEYQFAEAELKALSE
jgi:lipoprotein NlpI